MDIRTYKIDVGDEKKRLDVFLEENNSEFTRSHLKNQIVGGDVLVNGKMQKAGYKLKVGDEIILKIVEPKSVDLTPVDMQLEIIYQDKDVAVINKPQGLVVHPAAGNWSNTLVNALLYQIKDLSGINGEIRPGIVHRLDKDTSGLLLVAKNDMAHVSLSSQIQNKTCKRIYYALVNGVLKSDTGEITTYIARDKKNRLKMAVANEGEGKFAHTLYKVIKRYNKHTLVEFELKTGRTHQIRVHSKHINHPIVGDELYGLAKLDEKFRLNGQLLHAKKLMFKSPTTNEIIEVESNLPDYFLELLDKLD